MIGEEVIRAPVHEEKTVVTKRPVVKEENRITTEWQHVAENVRKDTPDASELS